MYKVIPLSFLVLLFLTSCCQSDNAQQNNSSEMVEVKKNKDKILLGRIGVGALQKPPFKEWYEKEFHRYRPDASIINSIQNNIEEIEFHVFMGTWCEDSQTYVPQFFKVLSESEYNLSSVKITSTDHDKIEPKESLNGYDIQFVPTFILYSNDEEIGRIVEVPETGRIEKDLLRLIK